MKFRFGLLPRVVLAIGLGVGCGFFFPEWATRIALTFNDIFGQFLSFVIPLLILSALAESPAYGILENTASAAGLIVLFLFIAAAVAAFLSCSFKNAPYAFLDKEPFDTEYGVTGMVSERQRQYKSTYARCNMVGTMLCILSPVPIFIGMAEGSDLAMILAVCGMLFLAGVGAAAQ